MPTAKSPTRPVVLASLAIASLALSAGRREAGAAEEASPGSYLEVIRAQAGGLRSGDRPPTSLEDWRTRAEVVRRGLDDAWGGFPDQPCPLDPQVLGTLDREGYRVEKVVFQ